MKHPLREMPQPPVLSVNTLNARKDILFVLLASLGMLLLIGYHPYAEDGGIYFAAVAARLSPALYPAWHGWVEAQTKHLLFVPFVAAGIRLFRQGLEAGFLIFFIASLVLLASAVLTVARALYGSGSIATSICAIVLPLAGVPVAGTGLYLTDPYLTARSFAIPLLVLAVAAVLRKRFSVAIGLWLAAALMHPLMALWGAVPLVTLVLKSRPRLLLAAALMATLGIAAIYYQVPQDTETTRELARQYWFPGEWAWYEWVGIILPVALLVLVRIASQSCQIRALANTTIQSFVFACWLAGLFVHSGGRTSVIARLQPMRILLLGYVFLLVLLAGEVLNKLSNSWRHLATVATVLLAASGLFTMQRSLYASTPHIEWPGRPPGNAWEQAFVWIRKHTPVSARIAADAWYPRLGSEDSHNLRAVAQRSVLPDRSKDAGIASVTSSLAAQWKTGSEAVRDLNTLTDAQRIGRLQPFAIDWIVLPSGSTTAFSCPYRNERVKVCNLHKDEMAR